MSIIPKALSCEKLENSTLKNDKKNCKKFGPCGIGEKALYLNSFYLDRVYYVPFSKVKRVFKRVAMSKGGFTGKGVFATIPYLVVVYDNGTKNSVCLKEKNRWMKCWCILERIILKFHF